MLRGRNITFCCFEKYERCGERCGEEPQGCHALKYDVHFRAVDGDWAVVVICLPALARQNNALNSVTT